MKPRVLLIVGLALAAVLLWWITSRPPVLTETPDEKPPPAAAAEAPVSSPAAPVTEPPAPPPPRTEESRVSSRRDFTNPLVPSSFQETARSAVAGPDSTIAGDLDKVSLMLRDYRTLTGENPVGSNAEIMKAIMGGNPKGAMLGPPEGQSVNGNGELTDHWGTPYFFHQLSKDLMEIRSAGPDGTLWNDDDITGK